MNRALLIEAVVALLFRRTETLRVQEEEQQHVRLLDKLRLLKRFDTPLVLQRYVPLLV